MTNQPTPAPVPAQRSPEWFSARKGRITGSMVGAILGLSPFMTRADAMRSMVRDALGVPREFTGNPATQWGTAMEAQARADYELETMHDVQDAPFVEYEDWLGASPDGYVGEIGLVEFKCPYGIRNETKPVFKSLHEQEHYRAQCQIQIFVTGREWCHFFQWTPHGNDLTLVNKEQGWLDRHLPILRQFHAEFLHELEYNAEEHLMPKRVEVDTPEAHALAREYDELVEALERAEERKQELLALMAASCDGRNGLFAGRKLTKVERKGSVSYAKAFKALMPKADLAPYTGNPTSYWTLS